MGRGSECTSGPTAQFGLYGYILLISLSRGVRRMQFSGLTPGPSHGAHESVTFDGNSWLAAKRGGELFPFCRLRSGSG